MRSNSPATLEHACEIAGIRIVDVIHDFRKRGRDPRLLKTWTGSMIFLCFIPPETFFPTPSPPSLIFLHSRPSIPSLSPLPPFILVVSRRYYLSLLTLFKFMVIFYKNRIIILFRFRFTIIFYKDNCEPGPRLCEIFFKFILCDNISKVLE